MSRPASGAAGRVRVLVVDDHAAVRSGLRLLLAQAGDVEVVGEAADGGAALLNARALRPDVVLMDLRMPGAGGIEATRAVVAEGLAQVLVLTSSDLDADVFGALRAGAAGFLLKTVDAATLVDAVRRVAGGGRGCSPPRWCAAWWVRSLPRPRRTGRVVPAVLVAGRSTR